MVRNDTIIIIIINFILILLTFGVCFLPGACIGWFTEGLPWKFSPFPAIPLRTMVIWIGRVTSDFLKFPSYYLSCDLAGSMEAKRVFPTSQDIYVLIFFLSLHLFYQFPSWMAGCPILGFFLSRTCYHIRISTFDWHLSQPAEDFPPFKPSLFSLVQKYFFKEHFDMGLDLEFPPQNVNIFGVYPFCLLCSARSHSWTLWSFCCGALALFIWVDYIAHFSLLSTTYPLSLNVMARVYIYTYIPFATEVIKWPEYFPVHIVVVNDLMACYLSNLLFIGSLPVCW